MKTYYYCCYAFESLETTIRSWGIQASDTGEFNVARFMESIKRNKPVTGTQTIILGFWRNISAVQFNDFQGILDAKDRTEKG